VDPVSPEVQSLSLRPWRQFFATFAVTSFSNLRPKTRAFNRKDRKGNAMIAKKGVFCDLQHGR
jgi:hypothetical protein